MRKTQLLVLFLVFSFSLWGQQEEQFTQFMYYKLGFNPAYAGSKEQTCISAITRSQWLGIDGAPQTQLLTFSMPLFNQRVGIGASVVRETIGVTERFTGEAAYAYRFRVGRGMLGIGVQGSVRLLRVLFSQTTSTQPKDIDGAIPSDIQSKYIPNFGVGIYYSNQKFYAGLSAPRLLANNIDFADLDQTISREVQHVYLMGGMLLDAGEKVKFQPQVLMKYVKGAPFDADINMNAIFNEVFIAGVSYRLGGSKRSGIGESISLLMGVQITESLLFAAAYDATLSDLKGYNSGSLEGVLRFCIGGKSQRGDIMSPRFF